MSKTRAAQGRCTTIGAIAATLALSACATGNEEGAFLSVNALVADRTSADVTWYRDEETRAQADFAVRNLMAEPLGADGAVELAFLRNPAVQASLASIGISEADVAQAGRLANPVVSVSRVAGNGIIEIERQILFSVLSVFTVGPRTAIAQDQAERTRYRTALEIVRAANAVRTAWVEAVAARERQALMDTIYASAEAANDLATRLAEAGSMTELDQTQIKVALAEIAGQRAKVRAGVEMARERLIRAMGVWGAEIGFTLPSALPALPGEPRGFGDIERIAMSKRLDVRAARLDVEALLKTVDLTEFTGFVSLLEVGLNVDTDFEPEDGGTVEHTLVGFELEFEIPIFDPGDAKVSRAKWTYMQAVQSLRSLAVTARSEAREAYMGYRASLDLAHHYRNTVVPLRARISQEELLRYNGMLGSVFELLAATRAHAQAAMTALDARRDFWLADIHVDEVLLAGGGGTAPAPGEPVVAAGGETEEH